MFSALPARLRSLGPGLILAAAGIGAGDVVVATVTGIRQGMTLLWAIVATAVLKYVVTEALARWQLATGETLVRAWVTRLPRWVAVYFGFYLVMWTFLVGASLSGVCGLAGATLMKALPEVTGWLPGRVQAFSEPMWAAVHAIVAAALVGLNRFGVFQRVMKVLVGVMAASVLVCAFLAKPSLEELVRGMFVPSLPAVGAGAALFALAGGIGGSLTVVCYGYWLRAEGWAGASRLGAVRADVRLAYLFTGLFAVALCVVAAGVHASDGGGSRIALDVAARLEQVAGRGARVLFLFGFWCTVFSAMLGVWQGVPHVYADFVAAWRKRFGAPDAGPASRRVYLGALAYLAFPPLVLLWFKQPVTVTLTFSVVGAFFMPFLALTLLYLNNRRDWMGNLANRWLGNAALVLCVVIFGWVCGREIVSALWK